MCNSFLIGLVYSKYNGGYVDGKIVRSFDDKPLCSYLLVSSRCQR